MQTQTELFIIATGLVILMFIIGTVFFLLEYSRRSRKHLTETQQLNEEHKIDLLNTQLNTKQQTQQYIGRELHDSVAQKITLASIYLQQISTDSQTQNKLQIINKVLNSTLAELRILSKNLTDDSLQNADLIALINRECKTINEMRICQMHLQHDELPPLNVSTKTSIYRVFQEFLQNSIKHALCKNIFVTVAMKTGELMLTLRDDGKGFDIVTAKSTGMGIDNIRRRIQLLGANFTFESTPNEGTVLTLTIPESKL